MSWNRDEIVKELEDNCPENAFVTIALMNPKSFKKLFNTEDIAFCGEGRKRVIVYPSEGVAEDYIVASYTNPDYRECVVISDDHVLFPQTGIFIIPLNPEDE